MENRFIIENENHPDDNHGNAPKKLSKEPDNAQVHMKATINTSLLKGRGVSIL